MLRDFCYITATIAKFTVMISLIGTVLDVTAEVTNSSGMHHYQYPLGYDIVMHLTEDVEHCDQRLVLRLRMYHNKSVVDSVRCYDNLISRSRIDRYIYGHTTSGSKELYFGEYPISIPSTLIPLTIEPISRYSEQEESAHILKERDSDLSDGSLTALMYHKECDESEMLLCKLRIRSRH